MASDPSKTEAATPKRIRDARNKGNVAKSQEMSKTISILAGLIGLFVWLRVVGRELLEIFRYFLTTAPLVNVHGETMYDIANTLARKLAFMLLPIMLIIAFCIFISLRIQVGKLWTTKVFEFKLSKFNPISGLKRMFLSAQTFIRLGKSLLQAICIGIAPVIVIRNEMVNFPNLYYEDALGVAVYILTLGAKVVIYALIPMIIISIVDLWYTRWSYKENLKMSKDEVKDERKQQEGDEKIKSAMRQKMMRVSAQRMMQQIPKADVVITNPTHIAIALKYDADESPAPVIVAKGVDRVAEKIKQIARENNVPIRENKPLARALYKNTEIGDTIPADLFQAVAIILAQIWKTKPQKKKKPH